MGPMGLMGPMCHISPMSPIGPIRPQSGLSKPARCAREYPGPFLSPDQGGRNASGRAGFDPPAGSRPITTPARAQGGGVERPYNLFKELKARGWPLIAADLGDLVEYKNGEVHDQALLKYETAMKALKALDYAAIGLGEFDFRLPLEKGLALTLLQ